MEKYNKGLIVSKLM